jgi:hypothetical protein
MALKKQMLFFNTENSDEHKYTGKIETPVYKPSHAKPHILMLCDDLKTKSLLREIDEADITEEEKDFLRAASWRHAVFHYERCADYYAHASPEMQRLMERSALVIIDFGNAIEQGYVQLCDNLRKQYLEEYADDKNSDT